MALPAILLKAKNVAKKGAKAYKAGKKIKSAGEEFQDVTSNFAKKSFIIVGITTIPAILIMIFIVVIVALPQTLFTMFGAVGGGNQQAYADTLTDVESSIEPIQEGLGIPHYLQYDSRWGNKPYPYNSGGSNKIASSACGPTSFAMVASYLTGKALTPDMVLLDGKYHKGDGTSWGYFVEAAKKFSCGSVKETKNWADVYSSLKEGHPVIGSYNGESLFTKHGHFIVLRGVASDGAVLVNDPNDSPTKKFVNRHFTENEMQRGKLNWWIFEKKGTT